MCDYSVSCYQTPPPHKYRKLTLLLLDCWQREYDERPYRNFMLARLDFEERMHRSYDSELDLATIVQFIKKRSLISVQMVGLRVLSYKTGLIHNFVGSLANLRRIELKLMNLPTEFFEAFADNVASMKVKELVLEGTILNDNDITSLRSFLINSGSLQYLDVAACSIDQFNFAILADGIHKSKSMIAFNASRLLGKQLTLDSEKITLIVSSLLWQNKLQVIAMEKCEFIAQDMEIIAENLYNKLSSLLQLNVAYNKIGPDGAFYLLRAIASSGTLKYLNMSGCGLGTHGGEHVAKYMSSCTRLESLLVQHNDIGAEAVSLILLTMKKPLKLGKLYLWGNKYNPRTGRILRRLIQARVVPQDNLDVTYTYDDTIPGYRVIPWRT